VYLYVLRAAGRGLAVEGVKRTDFFCVAAFVRRDLRIERSRGWTGGASPLTRGSPLTVVTGPLTRAGAGVEVEGGGVLVIRGGV
jgi:hypothetical protein